MSGIGSFFSNNNVSGDVTLKRRVNVENFKSNVNTALEDNKLTKAEYKSIKDSMVGGRTNLNNVISQAGIASTEQLETIFAKGKNRGEISVSPSQKQQLLNSLTGTSTTSTVTTGTDTVFTDSETTKINKIKQDLSYDRSDISSRYTNKDFLLSPEISGVSREKQKGQYTEENLNFVLDAKNALKTDNKEEMKSNITNVLKKYIQIDLVNVSSSNRELVSNSLRDKTNPPSLGNLLNSLDLCVAESITTVGKSENQQLLQKRRLDFAKAITMDSYHEPNPTRYIETVRDTFANSDNGHGQEVHDAAVLALRKNMDELIALEPEARKGAKANF